MNEYVIWIQKSLKLLDYEPGPVDGIDGRLTRAAVREYQTERGLTVDGLVGAQTHGALMT
ncbi:MAG: zinc D-Ala-D-Ala carboxypeptidase, partial [Eubacteriaceae bacterium]|nr:zinc D-Ala-D-Ala carboxypeptidase [Eubacteriaceae bacterium]